MKSVALTVLLSGCATVSGFGPAVPLSPGSAEVQVGVGLQQGGNILSRSTGYPLPTVAIGYRYGLKKGLDVGIRLMPVGVYTDLRVAVMTREQVHVAMSPGFSGSGRFGTSLGWGELGFHIPIVAEFEVSDHWTMAVGAESSTFIRGSWLSLGDSASGAGMRVDEYVGLGGGAYWKSGRWRLGWQGALAGSMLRPAPVVWTTGPILGVGPEPRNPVTE